MKCMGVVRIVFQKGGGQYVFQRGHSENLIKILRIFLKIYSTDHSGMLRIKSFLRNNRSIGFWYEYSYYIDPHLFSLVLLKNP
jgi:hypothetical protein